MKAITLAATVALMATLASSAGASAGWTRVTSPDGASSDQVGLVRTADGVLHVAWHHPTGPNTSDLLHTAVTVAGALGATTPIQSGWTGFTNPALVVDPGGVRAFWGGIRTTSADESNQDLNTALSPDGGGSWALQTGSVIQRGAQAYGSPIAATTLPNGTTLQAWAGTLGTWVHAGITPATPNHDFQKPFGNYGYDPQLATDATGRTVMAWYSSAAGHLGVLAQDVAADGSPIGAATTMPNTSDMASGMSGRTPAAARAGGGFYVGYPTGYPAAKSVRLWRVGSAAAAKVATVPGNGNQPVAVAAVPDGRLWVAWVDNRGGHPAVRARRSNKSATRLGATVSGGTVSGSAAAYHLDGSATAGGDLDVLSAFAIGTTSSVATYHRRLMPGLTLSAKPTTLRRRGAQAIRFTVTDAGDPVKGARVAAGGREGRTDARGRTTLRLAARSTTAKATKAGYVAARTRVKLR